MSVLQTNLSIVIRTAKRSDPIRDLPTPVLLMGMQQQIARPGFMDAGFRA
jgi:hypothetical protein